MAESNITKKAAYTIDVKPVKGNWRDTDKLEVVLTLNCAGETKVFKGVIPLTGIVIN